MGKRILTDEQIADACEMRERGLSCQQISRKFAARGVAVSSGSISWACLTHGADLPAERRRPDLAATPGTVAQRGDHVVRTFTPDEDRRLLDLDLAGLTCSEIARQLGRKPNSIRGRMATLARRDARADT